MEHSSVNGLVNETTVQQMYDMIVENARKYLDTPAAPDAKALRSKGKDRKKTQEQTTGKGSTEYACYYCGSTDHLIKDCPHKPAQTNQPVKTQPKVQQQKKPKGKGKGRGKDETKRSVPKAKGKSKGRPAARAVDGEEEEEKNEETNPEDHEEEQETPEEEEYEDILA